MLFLNSSSRRKPGEVDYYGIVSLKEYETFPLCDSSNNIQVRYIQQATCLRLHQETHPEMINFSPTD